MSDIKTPHDLDAERSVIGAAMWDNACLPEVVAMLPTVDRFFRASHQVIWKAVLGLYHAGDPVDFVTVNRAAGLVDGLCGHDEILEIRDCVFHTHDAVRHARIVADAAAIRDAIEAFQKGIDESYRWRDDATGILTRAIDRLRGVDDTANPGGTCRASEVVPEVLRMIEARRNGEVPGVPTGFMELDGLIGAFQSEDYVLLAARPSMGKTAFAVNVADYAAVCLGIPTLVISLEMGNPPIIERIISSRAGVNLKALRSGAWLTREQDAAVERAAAEIHAAPLFLSRRPSRQVSEVCNEIRRYRARHKIALAVLDYVQLLTTDNPRESEVAALTRISASLKGVTRDLGIPLFVLSQLSRANEARTKEERRPKLSDLRGSGALEQDADLVMFLHRPDYYDPNERRGEADCVVAKNRNGQTGEFKLWFDREYTRFRDFVEPVTSRREDAPF